MWSDGSELIFDILHLTNNDHKNILTVLHCHFHENNINTMRSKIVSPFPVSLWNNVNTDIEWELLKNNAYSYSIAQKSLYWVQFYHITPATSGSSRSSFEIWWLLIGIHCVTSCFILEFPVSSLLSWLTGTCAGLLAGLLFISLFPSPHCYSSTFKGLGKCFSFIYSSF